MADSPQTPPPARGSSRVGATLRALFRARITAGILVVLPLYVTILLIRFVFDLMRDSSLWVVHLYLRSTPPGRSLLNQWTVEPPVGYDAWWRAHPEHRPDLDTGLITVQDRLAYLEERAGRAADMEEFFGLLPDPIQWATAIVAVLLTVLILYTVGLFAANMIGRRVIDTFEGLLDRVPLVKTVYRASKQILATFTGDPTQDFQRVALIPFPQERMRCVGFITAIFRDSLTNEELATVFIPTTPNPTTGYLQILRRAELVELDWSVEDAVRTIMSGGILRPDFLTIVPKAEQKNLPPEMRAKIPKLPRDVTKYPPGQEKGQV